MMDRELENAIESRIKLAIDERNKARESRDKFGVVTAIWDEYSYWTGVFDTLMILHNIMNSQIKRLI